ncbi:MAG: Nif3-like dinuclear metal center hexameric protein [Gemmataceae bacterium]
MPTVADIAADLDAFAPTATAAEWDNVGLLLGDSPAPVTHILTCLTVTPEVAAEAVAAGAQLIVTHHPILFRGIKRLTTATAEGRMLLSLASAGVAVYSPHTAFDNCAGGINDSLAAKLSLTNVKPLRPRDAARSCKLVAFVPDGDLAKVSDALFAAGAGRIGEYRECSFRLQGTGTFFGGDTTNPTVGQKGRREEVAEWRLEVVCPEGGVERVVAALRSGHSYEEPAFDVYPLRPARSPLGEGRIGRLKSSQTLGEVALGLRKSLACGPVQVVGELAKPVATVALACGAAGEFLTDAVRAKADLFVTGEARFHDYLSAQAQGIALVLPGHYATERFGVEELAARLAAKWPGLSVTASAAERDPVTWV